MDDSDNSREEVDPRLQYQLEEIDDAMERFHREYDQGDREGALEDANYAASQFARIYRDTPTAFRNGILLTEAQAVEVRVLIATSGSFTVRAYSHLILDGLLVQLVLLAAPGPKKHGRGKRCLCLRLYCFDALQEAEERGPFDHLNIADIPVCLETKRKTRRCMRGSSCYGKILFRRVHEGTVGRLRLRKRVGTS